MKKMFNCIYVLLKCGVVYFSILRLWQSSLLVMMLMFGCKYDDYTKVKIESQLEKKEEYGKPISLKTVKSKKGTYRGFLDALRTFESDISLDEAPYYEKNYNNPSAVNYPMVEYPGRVIRDAKGNPMYSKTSVKNFFKKIGVADLYIYGSRDSEMFRKMQYSVINFIGFVGYQFSERDLWDLGYYTHYDTQGLEEYYSDVPNKTWANGTRNKIIGRVDVTDVNTWKGTFSGKHGINSFEDFKNPDLQDFIALDHFKYKYDRIVSTLKDRSKDLKDYLGTKLYWDRCIPKISPPPEGRSNEVVVTMSGLLAGAHLRGAQGVVSLIVDHENHSDEIGTTTLQYVQDYGGYDTPFSPHFHKKASTFSLEIKK